MKQKAKVFVVHGPMASGKTLNRDAIKEFLDGSTIIEWEETTNREIIDRAVILTINHKVVFKALVGKSLSLIPVTVDYLKDRMGLDWVEPIPNYKGEPKKEFYSRSFEDDQEAISLLESRGYVYAGGGIWRAPREMQDLADAMAYLVQEWDYGFQPPFKDDVERGIAAVKRQLEDAARKDLFYPGWPAGRLCDFLLAISKKLGEHPLKAAESEMVHDAAVRLARAEMVHDAAVRLARAERVEA